MRKSALARPAIFSLAAALAGCSATGGGDCPPLVAYGAPAQGRAARELGGLAADSEIARMIVDYGKMRDACRAAAGVHAPFRAPPG